MCGYFCITFIDFMLAGKKLTEFTNIFSPYDFEKNNNIILTCFKDQWNSQNKLVGTDHVSTKRNNRN